MDRRLRFLDEFLAALGVRCVEYSNVTSEVVEGTAIYDLSDPDERQDFCWCVSERDAPSNAVIDLVSVIREQKLLSIDTLICSEQELKRYFDSKLGRVPSESEFQEILESMYNIEVPMTDNGEESDAWFIHP